MKPHLCVLGLIVATFASVASAQVLDKQKLLDAETFWDNRDSDWFRKNIPFFECPDADINTTYYYRWELVTKHLTYGSPNSGYSFTEFIDRPFWSGAYGAISCPAGHQLYEVRWLRDPRYARDYARYWFRSPGAQPRNYSTWLADAIWATHLVHPDDKFIVDLLPDMVKNADGWKSRHWVGDAKMFWQTGHDDGMEFNISSRQTKDIVRGAPSYRPSFNAYMWADALAIARVADLAGDRSLAKKYRAEAATLKKTLQEKLWDPQRNFYFPMYKNNEEDADGNKVTANTLTYQSGRHTGSSRGREEIGYVPWQFGLPDAGYETAWKYLMSPDYFYAERGPTTVERHDPMFLLQNSCCWWSGQSWPYATTQTLKALANLLQNYDQQYITRADYIKLLRIYALSHRKNGKPYLAEALHPDTGSFEGHDGYNHSEHYFHSGFTDLVITGLVGLMPGDGDELSIDPLAPPEWDYFALDDLPYRGHRLTVVWDKTGKRYNLGVGLHVLVDGKEIASSANLEKLTVKIPLAADPVPQTVRINYAVNNDGDYFPRLSASFVGPNSALSKINDGNYWYHKDPPNRWTATGSPSAEDWVAVDFGQPRRIDTVKLYFLDDGKAIVAPQSFVLESWNGKDWQTIADQQRTPTACIGHRPNVVTFQPRELQKLRARLVHAKDGRAGLTELEAWGDGTLPYQPAPPPPGNLALNSRGSGLPKASASHSDRFGGTPEKAIDGKVNYLPNPINRWTSYESPDATDWLEIDFGQQQTVGRLELYIYDDRGGVQPPEKIQVQTWTGDAWREVADAQAMPAQPAGSAVNTITFRKTKTSKVRIVFTHRGKARSGVTEVEAWAE